MRKFLIALVALLLSAGPSLAASRVWISEFSTLAGTASGGVPAQIARLPTIADQVLDISGGIQTSAPFNSATTFIQIMCEVQCAIKVGGTATTSNLTIPALTPFYFGVFPGGVAVSVIANP